MEYMSHKFLYILCPGRQSTVSIILAVALYAKIQARSIMEAKIYNYNLYMRATTEARVIKYNFVVGRQLVTESEVDKVRVGNRFYKRCVKIYHHPIESVLLGDRVSVAGLGAGGVC